MVVLRGGPPKSTAQNPEVIKEKTDKFDSIEIKIFYGIKYHKVKSQSTNRENGSATYMTDSRLILINTLKK